MTTADAKATQEAKELLEYLKNTAGQQIITGQHTQTIPCEEIAYIRQTTGKEPKLRGFELLGYSPNINYADASPECLTEVEENKGTAETKASTPSIPISMRRKYCRKELRREPPSIMTWTRSPGSYSSFSRNTSPSSGAPSTNPTAPGSGGEQRARKSQETYTD